MSFPFVQPYFGLGNSLQTAQGGSGAVGGWVEVGRTTLGSTSTTIDVSSIPDKRYYKVLLDFRRSASSQNGMRFNNDSGSNYSRRYTYNGASDTTATSETSFDFTGNGSSPDNFAVFHISNLSGKEKLVMDHSNERGSAGAGNIGDRREQVSKWANTSNALDQITAILSASTYASGSEMVVLGWDPADTHTTNFWEELASVDITSGSQMTANFTAKKYLWIQFYYEVSTTSSELFFNNDQGNNYARRYSNDGGTDTTNTSIAGIQTNIGWDTNPHYGNMFVINNSATEKLVIGNMMTQLTAGAGTAPGRLEFVSKWANTSAQINRFDIKNTGSFSRGICKVWGSN